MMKNIKNIQTILKNIDLTMQKMCYYINELEENSKNNVISCDFSKNSKKTTSKLLNFHSYWNKLDDRS